MSGLVINPYAFGAAAFAPDDIASLRLWLDASDAGTITDAGAGAVSAWTSKDANARTFSQASASFRPTTGTATQNGLNTISFATDSLVGDDAASVWKFLHDGTAHTIFAVFQPGIIANPDVDYPVLLTGNGGGTSGMALLWQDASATPTNERLYHIVNNTTSPRAVLNQSSDGFMPANTHSLLTIVADPNNGTAASRSSMTVNAGTAAANNTQTGTPSASDPSSVLRLGENGAGSYLTGEFAEILMYSAALTSGEIAQVETYLATKWGITL